jgi:hypothetical protein
MSMVSIRKMCYCLCHAEALIGDAAELRHHGFPASAWIMEAKSYEHPLGVKTTDWVACVMSCDSCRAWHEPAFTAPAPVVKAPRVIKPDGPPPPDDGEDGG